MKIAVCDDCMRDALSVKRFLGGHEARVYSDVDSLLADVKNKKMRYDLYLLDIYMEGPVNGIELAKMLVREQEEAAICFISTSNDFYREAYDLYAVQYLLKPVREEDVKQLLERVSVFLLPYNTSWTPESVARQQSGQRRSNCPHDTYSQENSGGSA